MNIFSSKIEMNKMIKKQEDEINRLKEERDQHLTDIDKLKEQVATTANENRALEEKYVNTSLECEFCYTTLQKEFTFCPKCGRKIEKTKTLDSNLTDRNVFQTEADGNYLLITQYIGFDDKKIVIPASINGKTVIGIWNSVFEKCTALEEVVFEEGCKYIGKNAFTGCTNLRKVRLPKSLVEIGDNAFSGCAIEEIAVPPNVRVIGYYAFSCRSLRKILLPDGLKYISYGMLSNTSLEEIDIPQSVIHICGSAFSNARIKEIELPYNLYSIEQQAFDMPELEKITIHSNVKIINKDIFGGSAKPVIYCSAGSKGHLYARKYGLNCSEIPPQPSTDVQVCASSIILVFGSVAKSALISELYRLAGINKAATWSWEIRNWNKIHISKTMDMNDAIQLKNILQSYISRHSDYSRPDVLGKVQEFSLCKHWGDSVV